MSRQQASSRMSRDLFVRFATDAVCVACPEDGRSNDFGGPRSIWGSRLARAVHTAVAAGAAGLRGPNALPGAGA